MKIFKTTTLVTVLAAVTLSSAMVFAKITHTLLVIDSGSQVELSPQELPGHFRTTSDPLPDSVQKDGLENVHAAGSMQFSEAGLHAALQKIPSKSVIIMDLRRESHGQLNGNAISWFGPQNAANENKTPEQIRQSESRLLSRLKKSNFKWVYQILEKTDDGFIEKISKEFARVESVKTEREIAGENHAQYRRLYVEDFHKPDDEDVERFVKTVRHLPGKTWLYFHCRAGRGRTTTFMSMTDMMKNAKHVAFEDILQRQLALGGSNLQELPGKQSYKYKYAVERLNFLRNFYEYAKANNDNFSTTWLQWKNNKSVKSKA